MNRNTSLEPVAAEQRNIGVVLNTFRAALSTRKVQLQARRPWHPIGVQLKIEIGKRIEAGRKAAKLTQQQLGERCGWSGQSRISMYERGEREPTFDDLEKIGRLIELDLTDLVPHSKDSPFTLQEPLALYGGEPSTEHRLLRAFSLLDKDERERYLAKIESDAIANAALKREVGPRLRPIPDRVVEKHLPAAPSLQRRHKAK